MKILIVDDDKTNRIVLKSLLNNQQHEVVMAENGLMAIDVFESESPDMILMDVMMPVMDGLDATKIIKQKCQNKFVPIVFLTAMSEADSMVKCIETGGDDVMTKPYNGEVLCAKIEAFTRICDLYQTVHQQKQELASFRDSTEQEQIAAEKIFANIMSRGDLHLNMLKCLTNPADTLSGDIVLTARNPSGGLNILVGDFTGHGLAAAIGAMPVADIFYGMTFKGFGIEDIVPELNRKLRNILPRGRFLAGVLMHVDNQCGVLSVWNGGMPDAYLYSHKQQKITQRIESTRLPLSIVDNMQVETDISHYAISPYDKIYVYSDGVTEQENMAGVMFGEERLIKEIELTAAGNNAIERMGATLEDYRQGKAQTDDVTLLEITIDPDEMAALQKKDSEDQTGRSLGTQWDLMLELKSDTLCRVDPLPMIVQLVTDIQSLGSHRENLHVVLSELFNNALDHGLLELDSVLKVDASGFSTYYAEREKRLKRLTQGHIKVGITHEPTVEGGKVSIFVEDSGNGFDFRALNNALAENKQHCGRGIPLVYALCSSMLYSGNGNQVTAVYEWT